MPFESKYKKKYTKMLLDGLRADGKSILACCLQFGITRKTYENWCKDHPEFEYAASYGAMQAAVWVDEAHKKCCVTGIGNAAALNFRMKNTKLVDWVDKTEVHNTHEEQVHTLVIKTLPSLNKARVIEHEPIRNLPNPKPE